MVEFWFDFPQHKNNVGQKTQKVRITPKIVISGVYTSQAKKDKNYSWKMFYLNSSLDAQSSKWL